MLIQGSICERVSRQSKTLGFPSHSNQFPTMKMILLPMMVAVACVLEGCQTPSPELSELNNHFTYHGQSVNPRAVENLTAWISDTNPGPVAIDMAETADNNRYYGDTYQHGKIVGYKRTDTGETVFESASFGYEYIGRLSNGCHVLHTFDDGGGSGIFESLLLVKFVTESAFDESGKPCHRIVMRQMAEYPLGDRVNAQMNVGGNTVVWTLADGSSHAIQFN